MKLNATSVYLLKTFLIKYFFLPEVLAQRPVTLVTVFFVCLFVFLKYLFIYLVAPGLSCGLQTLSCGMRVGSSSLTPDRTWTPCVGSAESHPLHHQGSPRYNIFIHPCCIRMCGKHDRCKLFPIIGFSKCFAVLHHSLSKTVS